MFGEWLKHMVSICLTHMESLWLKCMVYVWLKHSVSIWLKRMISSFACEKNGLVIRKSLYCYNVAFHCGLFIYEITCWYLLFRVLSFAFFFRSVF